jgi:hypothetical protein
VQVPEVSMPVVAGSVLAKCYQKNARYRLAAGAGIIGVRIYNGAKIGSTIQSVFRFWHDPDPPSRLQSGRYRVVNGPGASRTLHSI